MVCKNGYVQFRCKNQIWAIYCQREKNTKKLQKIKNLCLIEKKLRQKPLKTPISNFIFLWFCFYCQKCIFSCFFVLICSFLLNFILQWGCRNFRRVVNFTQWTRQTRESWQLVTFCDILKIFWEFCENRVKITWSTCYIPHLVIGWKISSVALFSSFATKIPK